MQNVSIFGAALRAVRVRSNGLAALGLLVLAAILGFAAPVARADVPADIVLSPPIAVGTNPPCGVAIHGANVYVTDCSNSVNVINAATNTVEASITDPSFNDPISIAITANGEFAYVANWFGNSVSVINLTTNTVVKTINVGNNPDSLILSPDGNYVYVSNNASDTVSVIDTATNTVASTVPVGYGPWGLAITPDGNYVYVTNNVTGAVSVIDTALALTTPASAVNTITGLPATGSSNFLSGVAIANGYAYVTSSPENTVGVIDLATNQIVGTIAVPDASGIAITPDGKFAYVTNDGNPGIVSVIDLSSNTIVNTLNVGTGAYGIAVTPDGNFVYVGNSNNNMGGTSNTSNTVTVIARGTASGPAITANLPAGYVGTSYRSNLVAENLSSPAFSLAPNSTPLPDGLTLNADGSLTGTPTTPGSYTFTATVTGTDNGLSTTVSQQFTIVVRTGTPPPPSTATAAPVPTLGDMALALLGLLLACGAALRLRRR